MQAEWDEDAIVAKLVAGCLAAERAPRPACKPRAVIVIDEAGRIVVRHRSARTGGEWVSVRASTLDNARALQASLVRTIDVTV